MIKWRSNWLFF